MTEGSGRDGGRASPEWAQRKASAPNSLPAVSSLSVCLALCLVLCVELYGCGARSGSGGLNRGGFTLTPEAPVGVVILAHDAGFGPVVWRIPAAGGLADALRDEGFIVLAPRLRGADLSAWTTELEASLAQAEAPPGAPVLGVGHGWGGAALYALAARRPDLFVGVVGLGAPVARGAPGVGVRQLIDGPEPLDWRTGGAQVVPGRATRLPLNRALLTDGLPPQRAAELARYGLRPAARGWLGFWRAWEGDRTAPEAADWLPVLGAGPTPVLAIVPVVGGLFPTHRADPLAVIEAAPSFEVVLVSRAEGHQRDLRHLDLLLHPAALAEIHPRVIDWVRARATAAPP